MGDRPKVVLTTGLPASGKTTKALELVDEGYRRVNLDSLRKMLDDNNGGKQSPKEHEEAVLAIQDTAIAILVDSGFNVVVDNTHLTPKIPGRIRKAVGDRVDFDVIDTTDVPFDELRMRDSLRENPVGHEVIYRMAEQLERNRKNKWKLSPKWLNSAAKYEIPKPYAGTPGKPRAIIVDIDGTVAINDGHRGHYEYDKVFDDKPNWPVIDMIQSLAMSNYIVFVSGREDRCRKETERWLDMYDVARTYPQLFTRATGDHRPDYIIKAELFDAHIRDHFDVVGVFDDRTQVVEKCWRAMGIQTYQVAKGDF